MAVKRQFESFQDLLVHSDVPVLVDFYAEWCGPCQMLAPVLEQVGAQLKSNVQIVKINTERYPALADQYRIQALPTLVLFKQGQPIDRIEGLLSADQLAQRVRSFL